MLTRPLHLERKFLFKPPSQRPSLVVFGWGLAWSRKYRAYSVFKGGLLSVLVQCRVRLDSLRRNCFWMDRQSTILDFSTQPYQSRCMDQEVLFLVRFYDTQPSLCSTRQALRSLESLVGRRSFLCRCNPCSSTCSWFAWKSCLSLVLLLLLLSWHPPWILLWRFLQDLREVLSLLHHYSNFLRWIQDFRDRSLNL